MGRVTDSEENFSVYSQATLDAEDKAFVMKIQDTVRAAVEEARFAQVVGKMQEAKAAQMDTRDVPASNLPAKSSTLPTAKAPAYCSG